MLSQQAWQRVPQSQIPLNQGFLESYDEHWCYSRYCYRYWSLIIAVVICNNVIIFIMWTVTFMDDNDRWAHAFGKKQMRLCEEEERNRREREREERGEAKKTSPSIAIRHAGKQAYDDKEDLDDVAADDNDDDYIL